MSAEEETQFNLSSYTEDQQGEHIASKVYEITSDQENFRIFQEFARDQIGSHKRKMYVRDWEEQWLKWFIKHRRQTHEFEEEESEAIKHCKDVILKMTA